MPIHPYDRSHLLTLKNPLFIRDLERYFMGSYESDCTIGDVTEDVTGKQSDKTVSAVVVAKSDGVFCGGPLVKWFLKSLYAPIFGQVNFEESQDFEKGNILLELKGPANAVLRSERTLLNVMQRLCGIATQTDRYRNLSEVPVAATRKTLYGLLDKYAVAKGGGLTHRLNLGDAPIFKENHLTLLQNDLGELLSLLPSLPLDLPFVTVEIETTEQYLDLYKRLPKALPWPLFLMLDNFDPENLQKITKDATNRPDYLFFEASGGITLKNIEVYSKTGVNVLSIGALTHSVFPVDLSMRIG